MFNLCWINFRKHFHVNKFFIMFAARYGVMNSRAIIIIILLLLSSYMYVAMTPLTYCHHLYGCKAIFLLVSEKLERNSFTVINQYKCSCMHSYVINERKCTTKCYNMDIKQQKKCARMCLEIIFSLRSRQKRWKNDAWHEFIVLDGVIFYTFVHFFTHILLCSHLCAYIGDESHQLRCIEYFLIFYKFVPQFIK